MAGVSGQGTTYNLPNYTGELYSISPQDTPFLSAVGGLNGGRSVLSTEFEWQFYDLRAGVTNNAVVEGAAAPSGAERVRANVTNVCEIHQSAVEVSYTKMAATQLKAGSNNNLDNPIGDELAWQIQQELAAMAIDIEKSFLSGVYAKPGTNASARNTRGILTAIATNVAANGGTPRAITKAIVDAFLQSVFTSSGIKNPMQSVFICGPAQKVALSNLYSTAVLNQPTMTRNVGGVAIDTIITDFGTFGVMVDRWMPTGQVAFVDLSVCQPVWLEIPMKGTLFAEELPQQGASRKFQIYGEVGLQYGPESYHGLIKDLS